MKKTIGAVALAAMGLVSGAALAASSTLTVDILGPGGHSNGDYGNVNAVHAAARAVMNVEKAVPDAVVSHINGGVSVNAIAADGHFKVSLNAKDEKEMAQLKQKVEAAVKKGVDAENAFRSVKPGQLTGGVPAEVRYTIK